MDLNLIRVFVAVYEARSLTTAASRLYVTQPAVSQSLSRLRSELDDPLFARAGHTMQPTPLAVSIYPGFREAIAGIDRTVDTVHAFDPALSHKHLSIALSELGEIGWFPAIVDAVRKRAPQLRLEVVALEANLLSDWLARGFVDLAITPDTVPGGFDHALVKTQKYAVAMSEQNPLADRGLSLDGYVAAKHVTVASDSGRAVLEATQRRHGAAVAPHVTVAHFATLPPVLSASREIIATVPDTIATGWATAWPIVVKELPFEMAPIELCLYRRATTQQLAALDWFYATVIRAVQGSSGEFSVIHGDVRRSGPHLTGDVND